MIKELHFHAIYRGNFIYFFSPFGKSFDSLFCLGPTLSCSKIQMPLLVNNFHKNFIQKLNKFLIHNIVHTKYGNKKKKWYFFVPIPLP